MLETPRVINGQAVFGSDANNFAEFELVPVLNEFKTDETGHPVYEDVEQITIYTPGNNKSTFKARVTEEHKERFPKQYAAFKAQNEQVNEGTPLTEWPLLTKGQALSLKGLKIHTVEQLANLPDNVTSTIGMLGITSFRDKAKAYLSRAVDASEITKLYAKLEKLEADNAAMKQMLATPAEKPEKLKLNAKG